MNYTLKFISMLDEEFSTSNPSASPWPHALRYGVIWALISIIMQLVMYSGGMLEKLLSNQAPAATAWLMTLAGILIAVFAIYKAAVDYRADLGGQISYGKVIGVGALTGLVYGLIFAVFSYIFYTFIFTDYSGFMEEIMISTWEEAGMDEDEIESALGVSQMFISPMFATISTIPVGVLYGLIPSLIIGLIVKTD